MRQKAWENIRKKEFTEGSRTFRSEASASLEFARDTQETTHILVEGRAVGRAEMVRDGHSGSVGEWIWAVVQRENHCRVLS